MDDHTHEIDQRKVLDFSRVCRTVDEECRGIYFRSNTFYFSNAINLKKFIQSCPRDDYSEIISVQQNFVWEKPRLIAPLLTRFTNLRCLDLEVKPRLNYHSRRRFDILKLPGVKDLFQLRGLKHLSVSLQPWAPEEKRLPEVIFANWLRFLELMEQVKQPRLIDAE